MEIYYEGTDITRDVIVKECEYDSAGGGGFDSLHMAFESAADWHKWKPRINDRLRAVHAGLDTGEMFLHGVRPEGGAYRIYARSAPVAPRDFKWRAYTDIPLSRLLDFAAREYGLKSAMYGVSDVVYPYVADCSQSALSHLCELFQRESAEVVCAFGALSAVSLDSALARESAARLRIDPEQPGFVYRRLNVSALRALTVVSASGSATAYDGAYPEGIDAHIALGAGSAAETWRWAHGLLRAHNRRIPTVELETAFDPRMLALARVDIDGDAEYAGTWLVDGAHHDMVREITDITLHRGA